MDIHIAKVQEVGATHREDAVEERVETHTLQIDVACAHLEDLVIAAIEQIHHGDLLAIRFVDTPRKKVHLEIDCLARWHGNFVRVHAQHLGYETQQHTRLEFGMVRDGDLSRLARTDVSHSKVHDTGRHGNKGCACASKAYNFAALSTSMAIVRCTHVVQKEAERGLPQPSSSVVIVRRLTRRSVRYDDAVLGTWMHHELFELVVLRLAAAT